MAAVNHWLSGASPDVRGRWSSQRPSEPPTLTLDAFEQDAGLAALAWTRATSRCITDWQGNVHEIPASAKPRNGVRVVRNLFASSDTLSTQAVTVVSGATYVISCYGTGSITFTGAATGSLTGTGTSERVATTVVATTTTLTCTVAGSVTSAQCQRARPGQTGPDEYVSNGVLATPYHDGIGVDGMKYFVTDENGARITGTRGYRRRKNWVSAPLTTWTNDGATVSGGVMTSTGGNNRAYKVFTNLPSGPMFGFSCEVRAGTSPTVRFSFLNIQDGPTYTFATDAWTPSGSFLQGRELLADGWIRLWVYRTSNTTSWGPGIYLGSNSTMEIRNPQLEIFETGQTAPTAYVPTTTSAVEVVDASFDVNPIVPSIPVGVAQTNRITYPSALGSWSTSGSPTVTVGYDAQVGTYARITVSAANSVYLAASGFTGSARTETALMMRMVSTSGTLRMSNVEGTANGDIDLVAASISTTRFERVDRFHAAATVNTEFSATAGGAAGVKFDTESGTITVDVARVAQVEGERVHEIPLEATAVSTINADAPSLTWNAAYATNNEGTVVMDFTPRAETAIDAYYTYQPFWVYKTAGDLKLYQYDGTTSPNFGNQTEGTRTKVATSWQTGVGRYGYRDGVSKFAATAYDGAWQTSTLIMAGPMLLHRMQLHRTAEATTYLQGATS